jgi:hypothetical protein
MRISDLMDCRVVDHDGHDLGRVRDVRLVMDGPVRGALAALRLDGIVVGGNALAGRLGYLRGGVRGPWPLSTIMRRLEAAALVIDVDDVADWDLGDRRLRLAPGAGGDQKRRARRSTRRRPSGS